LGSNPLRIRLGMLYTFLVQNSSQFCLSYHKKIHFFRKKKTEKTLGILQRI